MGEISLDGMVFYAHHGYYDDEQERGNKFIVDVHFETDFSTPAANDNLEDAVNYELIYQLIKEQMSIRSKLLEHVAQRIINCIKTDFPTITNIKVKVAKINPPLKGMVDSVSATLSA